VTILFRCMYDSLALSKIALRGADDYINNLS
jgi:hypothetical protein